MGFEGRERMGIAGLTALGCVKSSSFFFILFFLVWCVELVYLLWYPISALFFCFELLRLMIATSEILKIERERVSRILNWFYYFKFEKKWRSES